MGGLTFDFNMATLIPVTLSALLAYALYRINRAQDSRDAQLAKVQSDLHRLELEVATQYIRSPEIDELRKDLGGLRAEFHTLTGAVNRLIGRLDAKT